MTGRDGQQGEEAGDETDTQHRGKGSSSQ
jgi:hypothetical protein